MARMRDRDPSFRHFATALAQGLRLPSTSGKIVHLLAAPGRNLSVQEIVRRVRVSERSVRQNLALLLRRGLLERHVRVTPTKKLAYTYALRSVEDLLAAAEREFTSTVTRLQLFARRAST